MDTSNIATFDIKDTETNKLKVAAAVKKVQTGFGESGEELLCCAVVQRAIEDCIIDPSTFSSPKGRKEAMEIRASAIDYLNSSMPHAQVCGVEPSWIKMILSKLGLAQELTDEEREYLK